MFKWFKTWITSNKARRKQALRDQLARDLWFFHENDNKGLLMNRLWYMPGVKSVHLQTGMYCFANVRMNDGFSIETGGLWPHDALRNAARKVVERLKDVRGLYRKDNTNA